MKKVIPVTLTLLLLCFAGTAIADRGNGNSDLKCYTSQGERINRHLDIKGDRIESYFVHKAARVAELGRYRLAHKFQQKGDQINRHLDRKGNRLHARFDQRGHKHPVRQHNYRTHKRSGSPDQDLRYYNRYNLQRQQPGL